MAAPSAWAVYNLFKNALGNKVVSLNGVDTIKMALFTSSSNAANSALTHSGGTAPMYSDLTNEVSNANGYTTGGVACAATWTDSAGTETLGAANATWNATGSGIVAEIAVLYDSTTGNLIAWCYLDSTPASVTVAAGNTIVVQISGSGVFTLT